MEHQRRDDQGPEDPDHGQDPARERTLLAWRALTLAARLPDAIEVHLRALAEHDEAAAARSAADVDAIATAAFDAEHRRRALAERGD